jgi:hypothetical protein
MRVKELIEELSKLDPTLQVRVVELTRGETRSENFWLSIVDLDASDDFEDEVVLIGEE